MSNTEINDIVSRINYDHYFDTEKWYKNVWRSDYEIISQGGFFIIIEFRYKFGMRIGHSRGGIRFDRNIKSMADYLDFIKFLKNELLQRNYMLLGIEPMEEKNSYNDIFEVNDFREHIPATALIYPNENWIDKFNSKKRYDLTYASKKGIKVTFYEGLSSLENIENSPNKDKKESIINKIYELLVFSHKRHKSKYPIPDKQVFSRIFENIDFVLVTGELEDEIIAFELNLYNASKTRIERVFASADENALKLRVPAYLILKSIEYFYKKNIKVFDLWGISNNENDGVTVFKKSLADEIVYFAPYSMIKVKPVIAILTMFLMKNSNRLSYFMQKRRN